MQSRYGLLSYFESRSGGHFRPNGQNRPSPAREYTKTPAFPHSVVTPPNPMLFSFHGEAVRHNSRNRPFFAPRATRAAIRGSPRSQRNNRPAARPQAPLPRTFQSTPRRP